MSVTDIIKDNWESIKTAPVPFISVAAVCLAAGLGAGKFYYSDQLAAKDGEIARYRVALGIDPASRVALITLNNQEMQAKALSTVGRLQDLCFLRKKKMDEIESQMDSGKINKDQQHEWIFAVHRELSEQFIRHLRSDTFNVDDELRRRLGSQAVATILGISPSIVADNGSHLDIYGLIPSGWGFDIAFVCVLADGIERMAKLLPP